MTQPEQRTSAHHPEGSQDAALVSRLLRRDEGALEQVYDLHAGAVFGLLLRLLDHATAQEVTQDVFLRLWQHPAAFDADRASLRAYLLVMARSRALDRLRSQRASVPLYTEEGTEWHLPDARPGPVRQSEAAQRRSRLLEAMQQLSTAHRESVERAYLQGQTREEIALAMGVPVGTVKSRLSYALKHLKQVFGEEVSVWLD